MKSIVDIIDGTPLFGKAVKDALSSTGLERLSEVKRDVVNPIRDWMIDADIALAIRLVNGRILRTLYEFHRARVATGDRRLGSELGAIQRPVRGTADVYRSDEAGGWSRCAVGARIRVYRIRFAGDHRDSDERRAKTPRCVASRIRSFGRQIDDSRIQRPAWFRPHGSHACTVEVSD
jgi:hypothetical protein